MNSNSICRLDLDSLGNGIPVITSQAVGFYIENCIVCFDYHKHKSGVNLILSIEDDIERNVAIHWSGKITPQIIKCYADHNRATDHASCAIALLIIREFTNYNAIEQANTGTTIDYYLASKDRDDNLIFNFTKPCLKAPICSGG